MAGGLLWVALPPLTRLVWRGCGTRTPQQSIVSRLLAVLVALLLSFFEAGAARIHHDHATMRPKLKKYLELAVTEAAASGPRPWPKLKAELVQAGFDHVVLEENHMEIGDMFLISLASCGQKLSACAPAPRLGSQSPRPQRNRPGRPISPTPVSSTKPQSHTHVATVPEDGWIRLVKETQESWKPSVTFSFDSGTENAIGSHIIEQFKKQLATQVQDDKIDLVCCLNSQPARTRVVSFNVQDLEDNDLVLGRNWNKTAPLRNSRYSRGGPKEDDSDTEGSTSSQLPKVRGPESNKSNDASAIVMSPASLVEYTAGLINLKSSSATLASSPNSPQKQQDKQPGLDTYPEPRKAKQRKARAKVEAWKFQSMTEEVPETRPQRKTGRASFDKTLLVPKRKLKPISTNPPRLGTSPWDVVVVTNPGGDGDNVRSRTRAYTRGRVSDSGTTSGSGSVFDTDANYCDGESEESEISSPGAVLNEKEEQGPEMSDSFILAFDDALRL